MKEEYRAAEVEVVLFGMTDIVTGSPYCATETEEAAIPCNSQECSSDNG